MWTIDSIREAQRSHSKPRLPPELRDQADSQVYDGEGGIFFVTSRGLAPPLSAFNILSFCPESRTVTQIAEICGFTRDEVHREARRLSESPAGAEVCDSMFGGEGL